jgi:PAS domain S-box-containing protein
MVSEKSTVLYIDDDPLSLEIFKEIFHEEYNVITLNSTKNAVEVLMNNQVKVIMSDQCMPEENGIDFIKRINVEFPDIIKIIFTAFSSHDLALEAINDAGIYKFLLKPWDQKEIKNAIETAIRVYDLQHEKNRLLLELQRSNDAINEAYKKLDENEKKFYSVFAKSNDSIYILNQQEEIIEANQALIKLIGYKETPCNLNNLNTYIKSKFPVLIEKPFELSKNSTPVNTDFEIGVGTDDFKVIEISSNEISFNNKNYILSIIHDITERRMFEKKIFDAIVHTQEEEQGKYARELHDGLGPILSTLKMYIEWLSDSSNNMNKEKISQQTIVAIDGAINLVKEIANNLSPHILQKFGLINTIQTNLEQVKNSFNIDCVVSSNLNQRLPSKIEVPLYRILMECINNSLKHAKAKRILIKFKKADSHLTINYSDNGHGFDVQHVMANGKGMGLFNIQNRVRLLGGNIKLISNPGIGTDFEITLNI